MSSRCKNLYVLMIVLPVLLASSCSRQHRSISATNIQQRAVANAVPRQSLRVCADPNNLPFSNQKLEGFENQIAALVGREMNLKVEYAWSAQRRGFIRNTLKAGLCDVIIGMPSSSELALTTSPYYRSTYTFVYRKNLSGPPQSFDDPALRKLEVGVQMIGDDATNSPPAHALANRNIVQNVKGYSVYGDYRMPNPPAAIVDAVAKGDVDVAVVWGPLAGFFAHKQRVPLSVVPVSPQIDLPYLPFVFDISMGVRREDEAFRDELNAILVRRHAEIEQILDTYHIPRIGNGNATRGL